MGKKEKRSTVKFKTKQLGTAIKKRKENRFMKTKVHKLFFCSASFARTCALSAALLFQQLYMHTELATALLFPLRLFSRRRLQRGRL